MHTTSDVLCSFPSQPARENNTHLLHGQHDLLKPLSPHLLWVSLSLLLIQVNNLGTKQEQKQCCSIVVTECEIKVLKSDGLNIAGASLVLEQQIKDPFLDLTSMHRYLWKLYIIWMTIKWSQWSWTEPSLLLSSRSLLKSSCGCNPGNIWELPVVQVGSTRPTQMIFRPDDTWPGSDLDMWRPQGSLCVEVLTT